MNILVIGDIMLDINYISEITRNASEANIPIYNILDNNYILGGAANVAKTLTLLGTNNELLGVAGNDNYYNIIKELLNNHNIKNNIFIDFTRNTTTKHRIFYKNKINVRYDIETTSNISKSLEEIIIKYITNKNDINAIIISDYDKGVITENLCQTIIQWANSKNIVTFVDPKIKNYRKYKNCFLFKPNENEAEKITESKNIEEILGILKDKIQCQNILLTRGNEGMILNNINNKIEHKTIIDLVDVTGAGDIVLSVLVYEYLKTNDLLFAAKVANYVAGKSVSVIGNYLVSKNDIDEYYEKYFTTNKILNKIIYDYEIDKLTEISKNKNIVFTNGCFDILHSAHIKLLQFSKKQGDLLVVGLNSDESIKQLKGPSRPINNIQERSHILELFDFIDYIVIFNELTPYNIIKIIKPNIMVKGSDYKEENIIGREFAKHIVLFDYIQGKSSTNVIKCIRNINS